MKTNNWKQLLARLKITGFPNSKAKKARELKEQNTQV